MNELKEWFEKFWFLYPSNLCHNRKGSKDTAFRSVQKIYKTGGIKELERIEANTIALIKYDKQDYKPDRWPFVSTYFNQSRYDREIFSRTEREDRPKEMCECGAVATVKDSCSNCWSRQHAVDNAQGVSLRNHASELKKMGLEKLEGESMGDWGVRCRQYARENFGGLCRLAGNA